MAKATAVVVMIRASENIHRERFMVWILLSVVKNLKTKLLLPLSPNIVHSTAILYKDCHSERSATSTYSLSGMKGAESKNPESVWVLNTISRRSTRIFVDRFQL